MELRNALLVAYRFPPLGGSGVQRAVKLARYLPSEGWRVHVLTAGHTHDPQLDASLVDELGHGVVIHRALGFEPGALAARVCRLFGRQRGLKSFSTRVEDSLYWRFERWCEWLRLPEPERLWVASAVRTARRIIRKNDVRVVITTSPPHSTQWVGHALQQNLCIPWIADLRDPILDNFAYDPSTSRVDRHWQRLERVIVEKAARVVVTCPELADRLQQRHPGTDPSRFSTITNGYDTADEPRNSVVMNRSNGRFVLSHVGSFYRAQTVDPLVSAVRRLIATRPDLVGRFELRLVGSVSAQQRTLLRDTDDAFLRLLGYQQHEEAVKEMATADALFFMTPVGERGRYCIPSKMFEYLAFGRHIIALVHDNTTLRQMLVEAGNVSLVEHRDVSRLAQTIENCYDAWSQGKLDRPRNQQVLRHFRRDCLTAKYARILDECVSGRAAVDTVPDSAAVWEAA